jgi:hypothetical protein
MTKRDGQPRETSDKQVEELIKLLIIWPQVTGKVCQKYLYTKLGVKMTRSALQTARARLGLSVPEHTELTIKKQAFTRLALAAYTSQYGALVTREEARREVRKQVRDHFDEDVNTILLNIWIDDGLVELQQRGCPDVMHEATEELKRLGILPKKDTNQIELI